MADIRLNAEREGQPVVLGVAKSVKQGDQRVAVPPDGIRALRYAGWQSLREGQARDLHVLVEHGAGAAVGFTDEMYAEAGAELVSFEVIRNRADILVDVKQRVDPDDPDGRYLLPGKIHVFYAHVEKGQGMAQLKALLLHGRNEKGHGATLYSPETFFRHGADHLGDREEAGQRLINLGYESGVGAAYTAMEGVKISYEARAQRPAPFAFMPDLDETTCESGQPDDPLDVRVVPIKDRVKWIRERLGDAERNLRFGIIGSENGLSASGAKRVLDACGLTSEFLNREVTGNKATLKERLQACDAVINCSTWYPGDPRIIDKAEIESMKEGAVFVDSTCDQDARDPDAAPKLLGGVRYSYESRWGDPWRYYWVGPTRNTRWDPTPRERPIAEKPEDKTHVLYSACGMIPGGPTSARRAGLAYFGMLFPYLVGIIRAVAQGVELPREGLVLLDGRVVHPGLRKLIFERPEPEFKQYKNSKYL